MYKVCKKCNESKQIDSFYKAAGNKDGLDNYCKDCSKERFKKYHTDNIGNRKSYQKEYRKNNKDKIKNTNLLWRYSITSDTADKMFVEQDYKCGICCNTITKTKDRHIDHCHSTGKVRGILCSKCNTAIGLLQEDTDIMFNAISYITKHNGKVVGFSLQEMNAKNQAMQEQNEIIKDLKSRIEILESK